MKTIIRSQSQLPIRRSYKPARRLRFRPVNPLTCCRGDTGTMAEDTINSVITAIREDTGLAVEEEDP